MIKAVIFDMDGLMIDSESLHYSAYNITLKTVGYHLSKKDYQQYIGRSDIEMCRDLVGRFNLPISAKRLEKQKGVAFTKFIRKGIPAQPGLKGLLRKLKAANLKLAVASSSHLVEIRDILKSLKISNYFAKVISADAVEKSKPNPEIYLLTAKKLGVRPKECLVLEDAFNGIKAAKAAKMKCYAIPSRETRSQNFSAADRKLKSLREVYAFFKQDSKK